jgi:hypothetical protein
MLKNCKLVNIVWVDRGIILTIIYYIIKYYDKLLKKTIIIDNEGYRNFLGTIFPLMKIKKFTKHYDYNFYFNVRKINRYQDIIIDYISNYNKTINTTKIKLVPWFDMNDPLIVYKYSNKYSVTIKKYLFFIDDFVKCRRGNYNGNMWDAYIEKNIILKYRNINRKVNLIQLLNNFLLTSYTNTVKYIPYPVIYPVIRPIVYYKTYRPYTINIQTKKDDSIQKVYVKNDNINDLILLITEKINNLNKLI